MKWCSGRPSPPTPKRSSTVATTLPAAPAPFVLVYPNVVWCERVTLTTVSMEAILRRLSTLVNGITSVLLVGSAPPLPTRKNNNLE